MRKKKECIAMLLAGGQGTRLCTLTLKTAKPAVPFGSKYRLIDFPLSNCSNSGIDTVGVLTQYCPLELNEYIGNGEPWGLDKASGGITILPPYQSHEGSEWYCGTANAVYQNLEYIDKYSPEYVLILSGDQIYKMNYKDMLDFHKKNKADCTIAVINVSLSDASRFGILSADRSQKITEFEEKPEKPKSTLASMGIYIFNIDVLKKYLKEDAEKKDSSNDFGKNIIPSMIKDGISMYAYPFDGYWRDVGTLESFWRANMELLGERPLLELNNSDWKIYSRSETRPPLYIGKNARIKNSIVTQASEILGNVENSVIFSGVKVGEGSVINDSVILENAVIGDGANIQHAIIESGGIINAMESIGKPLEARSDLTVSCGNTDSTEKEWGKKPSAEFTAETRSIHL